MPRGGFVEYGFVAIENHGVDRQALVNAYQSMRALFDLSEVQKSKYESRRTGRQRGYTPFGKERAKDASEGDLKEFWHVGPELPPGDVLRHRIPDNIWPLELPEFREHSVALWQSLHDCGFSLLEALALSRRARRYLYEDAGRRQHGSAHDPVSGAKGRRRRYLGCRPRRH